VGTIGARGHHPAHRRLAESGGSYSAGAAGRYSATQVNTDSDAPAAPAEIAKRTVALLRDARSVQRRLDTLAGTALAIDDPSLPSIAEARAAVDRLVFELAYRQRGDQRRTKAAGRRIR